MQKLRVRLQKIASWLSLHRREMVGVVCVLALVVVVVPAFAQDATSSMSTPEKIAVLIATLFAWIAQTVVKFIVVIIDVVVVPIMRYNSFVTSPVVGQGWAVVRDLVNMFFVVILLLIAFQTIFGVGRADWKKQVPRLLIMAIVINFSRTIAGIMIDFGQVVMFTFVNAIADVAGGNFIQLFGLDHVFSFSSDAIDKRSKGGTGAEVFDFFGAAFLTMVLTFVILATMIILAALLAFRIVVLWCLIIVAPLTFFLGGAKGVIGGAEGYYSDWWKRFSSAVSLGPILAFFVWLSLAAASSGNLAEKQGFDVQTSDSEEASVGDFITEAFDAPRMTSLIIAIALLFAGFEVSQQTASSIGGHAGAMAASGVKGIPGLARSLAKVGVPVGAAAGAMALAPAATLAGGGIALAGVKSWKSAVGTSARESVVGSVGEGLRNFGGAVAKTTIPGTNIPMPILSAFGRRVQGLGFKTLQAKNTHKEHEWEEAAKANGAMGFDNMRELSKMPVTSFMTEMEKLRIEHAKLAVLNSKSKADQVTADDIKEAGGVWGHAAGELPDKELDKAGTNALARFPVMLAKKHNDDGTPITREEKKKRMAEQLGFAANSADKLREIRRQNFEDPEDGELFIEVAKETKGRATNDKSVYEHLQDGKADQGVKDWFEENDKRHIDEAKTKLFDASGDVGRARQTALGAPTTENNAALTAAIASLAEGVKSLNANDLKKGVVIPAMMTPHFAEAFGKHAKPETLAAMDTGLKGPFIKALDRRDAMIEDGAKVAKKKIEDGPGSDDDKLTAMESVDNDKRLAKASVDEARTRVGQGPGGYDRASQKFTGTDGTVDPADNEQKERKEVVNQMVVSNPQVLEQLTSALGDFKGELAESIADGIKKGGPAGAVDNGEAVMNKLLAELKKPRTSFEPGNMGDIEYRRTQDVATTAINNLARILKETNKAEGLNTAAIARVSHMRQRNGV